MSEKEEVVSKLEEALRYTKKLQWDMRTLDNEIEQWKITERQLDNHAVIMCSLKILLTEKEE